MGQAAISLYSVGVVWMIRTGPVGFTQAFETDSVRYVRAEDDNCDVVFPATLVCCLDQAPACEVDARSRQHDFSDLVVWNQTCQAI